MAVEIGTANIPGDALYIYIYIYRYHSPRRTKACKTFFAHSFLICFYLLQVLISIYFRTSTTCSLAVLYSFFHLDFLCISYLIMFFVLQSTCPNHPILELLITSIICGLLTSPYNSLFLIPYSPSLIRKFFSIFSSPMQLYYFILP